jgi:hypothetical protein
MSALHGALRTAEDLRSVGDREVVEVAQHDRGALAWREFSDSNANAILALTLGTESLR